MILGFLRRMPRPAQVAAAAIPLVVLLGAFVLVRREAPGRVGVRPSPSACAATTCATPSPSPSPSESPLPTPPPPLPPPPSARAAVPPPPPPVPCSAGGGEPAGNIAANYPVALAFAPDGRLFWAERSGTVKVWQGGGARVFATVATSTSGERGLLGLAISPTFASDRYVYAMYSETDNAHQTVVRWTDCNGQGANRTTIVANLPTGPDCCHKGGRIAFGPDGLLYVTVGDNHQAPAAQVPCDVRGKILRYRADGGVPPGNVCGPVFAIGLRNPFGLAFSPAGQLFVTNNGPSGDAGSPSTGYDTVYFVTAGGNYSWPACYGYAHPIAGTVSRHGAAVEQRGVDGRTHRRELCLPGGTGGIRRPIRLLHLQRRSTRLQVPGDRQCGPLAMSPGRQGEPRTRPVLFGCVHHLPADGIAGLVLRVLHVGAHGVVSAVDMDHLAGGCRRPVA